MYVQFVVCICTVCIVCVVCVQCVCIVHCVSIVYSVRNNGRTSDIVRPFWSFVRSKNAGFGHLAEHNLRATAMKTGLKSLCSVSKHLW